VTTTFTPEELAKLPKWAREKVERIQRQRDEAINLATVRAGEPTGIRLGHAFDRPQVYIPDTGEPIQFDVGPADRIGNYIEVCRCPGGIRVSSGHHGIVVKPAAANAVSVICQEWTA